MCLNLSSEKLGKNNLKRGLNHLKKLVPQQPAGLRCIFEVRKGLITLLIQQNCIGVSSSAYNPGNIVFDNLNESRSSVFLYNFKHEKN